MGDASVHLSLRATKAGSWVAGGWPATRLVRRLPVATLPCPAGRAASCVPGAGGCGAWPRPRSAGGCGRGRCRGAARRREGQRATMGASTGPGFPVFTGPVEAVGWVSRGVVWTEAGCPVWFRRSCRVAARFGRRSAVPAGRGGRVRERSWWVSPPCGCRSGAGSTCRWLGGFRGRAGRGLVRPG